MSQQVLKGGLLVVFDGIDGAGKSTQLELAKAALAAEDWPLVTTRNLGGTPIGEELRKVIKAPIPRPTETNLYISVAIQEALTHQIAECRARNQLILMDRGPLSLAAYEIYGSGLAAKVGWPYVDAGMGRLSPELYIVYTVDVKTALGRLKPAQDYFETKPPSYFADVARGYLEAAQRFGEEVVVIDGNRSIEAVHAETMAVIKHVIDQKS